MSVPGCRSWAMTHVGVVRTHNEDAFVDRPDLGLWAVADGAGGHDSGEVASGMIAAALTAVPEGLDAGQLLAQVRLRLIGTHEALREEAERRGGRSIIASTVVALILRDGHFACLWAGDSRAYLLRAGEFGQISHDHSLVQELVDCGAITAAEAEHHPHANVITRAVGTEAETLEIDKVIGEAIAGDRFLLCSDGLSKMLGEAEIAALVAAPEGISPAEALVAATLARGANDNVTAVVVEVVRR